ncbi:acyl-CoA dehydrogenase family protein [Variovorax sp. J31P207]|uniref:acyl-CoA dehydrogenase family protein n=1 Tax=Variovorax sp. J31P207 TaxID=3053510 RepID=UPI002578B0C6|nr:acyl-CoA dehydrogenase family protein [Variovorax sp. J31P207]MDM0071422.1 acyl-CoA dehydrogenase family protein [Variovorax sp. J31P207]
MGQLFNSEHEEMRRSVRRFVQQELDPFADAWEEAGAAPLHEVFAKAGQLGLLGINKPPEYGGLGLDFSWVIVVAEELGRAHAGGIPFAIGAHASAIPALANYGTDELRQEFLAPAIQGDAVACIGVSEETAGSDVSGIKTTARKDGGDWVINGSKMWITSAPQGDWISLLANTSAEGGPYHNKSLIVVPMNTPGVSVGAPLRKLGMHCSDTAPVFFDNVRVPLRHLIGEEGKGFAYQMEQFQHERLWGCVRTLSGLDEAIRLTVEYTGTRRAFGKTLLENQVIYHRLADYQSQIECVRSLAYRAVDAMVAGEDVTRLASIAKYMAGKLALELPSGCAQYFGGQGYMWENRITRLLRDLRIVAVGGGANEVMLEVIAKELGWINRRRTERA